MQRSLVDELQRGFEIAGTGVGVVFAALVSLAVVTTLLGRALRRVGAEPSTEAAAPAPAAETPAPPATDDDVVEPALVAAMAAAVHFVRRGFGASRPAAPRRETAEDAGAWRVQGRQALMSSQGNRVRPRNSRD